MKRAIIRVPPSAPHIALTQTMSMSRSVLVTPCQSQEDEPHTAWTVTGGSVDDSGRHLLLPEQPQQWLDWLHTGAPVTRSNWDTLHTAVMESPCWQIGQPTSPQSGMVRWRGMIQDMREPEYFSRNETSGSGTMDHDVMNQQLSERTPVVMVSLPGTTLWHQDETRHYSSDSNLRDAKRFKPDDVNHKVTETEPVELRDDYCSSTNVVLVNFYLDQYPSTDENQSVSPLKLNQIVEVYGILENNEEINSGDDAMEVATSESQMQDDLGFHESGVWDEANDDRMLLPSHTPRLHVMWFRVSSLDESPVSATPLPDAESDDAVSNRAPELLAQAFQQNATPNGTGSAPSPETKLIASAVWMLLNSMAERHTDGSVVATPHETSLGCAALHIVLPSTPLSSEQCPRRAQLIQTLKAVTPVVQVLTVTAELLDMKHMANPSRHDDRRLQQTVWQLPAGSVVVLDIRALSPKTFHPQYVSARQWSNWQTCVNLCRQHQIHYVFDGGVRIPFEADYRIIVLSNSENAHILPCALTVQWEMDHNHQRPKSGARPSESDTALELAPLRNYLRRCRLPRSNVKLSPALLERAQSDFLLRRAAHRTLVEEDDFHRWLTLTRLQARSRRSSVAEVDDWTTALLLDDAMQASIAPAIRAKLRAPKT